MLDAGVGNSVGEERAVASTFVVRQERVQNSVHREVDMERYGVVEVGDNKGVGGTAGAEENKECLDAFADGVDDLCIHKTGLRYIQH